MLRKTKRDVEKPHILENKIAAAIAEVLHDTFSEVNSAVKVIGLKLGAHPRAVRNWYEGKNAPSAANIFLLARHIPAITEAMLKMSNQKYVWDAYQMIREHNYALNAPPPPEVLQRSLADKTASMHITLPREVANKLNQRQLWFLGRMQQGLKSKPEDIIRLWKITARTAWRDIAALEKMGLIQFTGPPKKGSYTLTNNSFLI